jgi:hypothetical protein
MHWWCAGDRLITQTASTITKRRFECRLITKNSSFTILAIGRITKLPVE